MIEVINLFPTKIFIKQCNLDLDSIKKSVYEHQKTNESKNHSNVGGYQGHGFKNDDLNSIIANSVPQQDSKRIKEVIIDSWVGINKNGDYNEMHSHDPYTGTVLSGTFYVSAPNNCGNLRLYDPRFDVLSAPDMKYYNNGNRYQLITPKENLLVMFPAWLNHSVEPNNSNQDRISISFNMAFIYE